MKITAATLLSVFSLANAYVSMSIANRACFGAGCYWGTEKFTKSDFGRKVFTSNTPIVGGKVGFMAPASANAKANPSYEEVCRGDTGHVEVYDFEFDGKEETYEALVKHFFMYHDPTTLNRQGNDRGTQYASAIFCYDDKQKEIAAKVKSELQGALSSGLKLNYATKDVTTAIIEATTFYPASGEHQEYLDKNPWGYCNHLYRFLDWPATASQ